MDERMGAFAITTTDKQLASLLGRVCRNNSEKYQLLQERDELLYKDRIKNRDVTTMENVIVSIF